MKKLRFLTIIGAVASLLLTSVPSYAETYTNGATSGSIAVTAVVSSTYSVTLPATLELTLTEYVFGVSPFVTMFAGVSVVASS